MCVATPFKLGQSFTTVKKMLVVYYGDIHGNFKVLWWFLTVSLLRPKFQVQDNHNEPIFADISNCKSQLIYFSDTLESVPVEL